MDIECHQVWLIISKGRGIEMQNGFTGFYINYNNSRLSIEPMSDLHLYCGDVLICGNIYQMLDQFVLVALIMDNY